MQIYVYVLLTGGVVGDLLEDIIPILVANLNPEKDAEVRLKVFSLLSRLVLHADTTVDSTNKFGDFAVVVVKDMVLPNLVWTAGRTASAIRLTAVSCLWALLQSGMLTKEKVHLKILMSESVNKFVLFWVFLHIV